MFIRLKNDKRGFTLVEMVVSVLILGIAAGAMLGVFMISRVSIVKAKYYIQATNLARARMEDLKDQFSENYQRSLLRDGTTPSRGTSSPYQISNNSVTIDVGRDINEDGNFGNDGDELTGNRITQVEPIGSPEEYLKVTVIVTWSGYHLGGGSWQGSESLVTYISK